MLLYLITHAHTAQNEDADARSWRLSAHGVGQSEELSRLPFWETVQRIVLSSERKTYLTVEPVIAQGKSPFMSDARFDELGRTGWMSDYSAQVRAVFAHPSQSIGGWEPAADALARFMDGIDELRRAYPNARLALVSHGLVLSLYRAHLLGQTHVRYADWQTLSFGAVGLADPVAGKLLSDFEPVVGGPSRV